MTALAHHMDLRASSCRFCGRPLSHSFLDLGISPPANDYVRASYLNRPVAFYPLHALVCEACFLVQLEDFSTPEELFSDYAYFSSYSDSWLRHSEEFAGNVAKRFDIGPASLVMEVASNDGYLLQYFAAARIPVLGIEPAANVARVATDKGIPTEIMFFGRDAANQLVESGKMADLLIGNNVLAHVPNINDFVAGLKIALKPEGVISIEFPHLMRLISECQFDTIYHEHYSYLSLLSAEQIFAAHGLRLFDVEELSTHGGSLRIFACHDSAAHEQTPAVAALRTRENAAGLNRIETYEGFSSEAGRVKRELLNFLIKASEAGKSVAGYGAPAKGNTLLNYCGVGPELLPYTVDRSPHKQGMFLPGSRIPVRSPDKIRETRPDYLLILPWNLREEIIENMAHIRDWGGQFVVPIPEIRVFE